MPKNKFQDVVFTIIMATIMVYGMVVYNIALNTGTVDGTTFIAALHELPIMVPVAFILEFFIVGKLARMLAFTVMKPTDRPQFITYAIFLIDRYIYWCVNGRGSKETENNKFYNSCTSLNAPIGEDETEEVINFIEGIDYGFENIEEKIFLQNLRKELEEVMQSCNTLEQREVLKNKYGWNAKPMALNDIADIFNSTVSKVRNTEILALRKLRNSSWAMQNVKEFAELGYIDKFSLEIFRSWGIDV